METMNASPRVEKQAKQPETKTLNFAEAMEALLDDKKVRRQEWPEDGTYLFIKNEQVTIFKPEDKLFHPLIISSGDILGTDWVIC